MISKNNILALSTDSCRSLNADRPLFRALNMQLSLFTGKIKLNYLVIKVVLSTSNKRTKDHKIDLEIIMTINIFLVSTDQILMIINSNVLVFANRVTYLYWRAQYSINPVFINRTPYMFQACDREYSLITRHVDFTRAVTAHEVFSLRPGLLVHLWL